MTTGFSAGAQRLTDYISGNTNYGTLNTIGTLGPVYAADPNWANSVSNLSGIPVNETLDPNNATQMAALQQGIIKQEQGAGPANSIFSQLSPGTLGTTSASAASTDPDYSIFDGGEAPNDTGASTGNNIVSTSGATGGGSYTTAPDGTVTISDFDTPQIVDFGDLPDNIFDGSSVAPAVASGAAASGAGTAAAGAGGIAVNLTDETGLPSSVSGAGTAAKAGLTTAGGDVQTAAGGLAGTGASIINSAETYTSRAFVMIALVVMGAIFVAFGLSIFGKRALAAVTP